MRYGTSFPLDAPVDSKAARDLAQALEGAGYDYLQLSGHLLAADVSRVPSRPPGLRTYRDPFALFGYLAAVTDRIGFRTGILILPLCNTVEVARASAELANLSAGRFELGVGIARNQDDYAGSGQDFHQRGRRVTEQIALLRELWREPYVTFKGRWHQIEDLGLGGGVPQYPIPLWIGSRFEDRPIQRAAEFADGWMPLTEPSPEILTKLDGYLDAAGRDRSEFGLTIPFVAQDVNQDEWIAEAQRLKALGATDLTINAPLSLSWSDTVERVIDAKQAIAAVMD